MKNKIYLIIAVLLLIFLKSSYPYSYSAGQDLKVWSNNCGGNFQNGQNIELLTNDPEAKIFWTIFPNGSPAKGNIYEGPIDIKRSSTLYFFAFTDEINATKYEICRFDIESAEETNHLKILKIDPVNKKVIIKNWSKFDTNLSDWKLESLQQIITLPKIILKSEEEYEIEIKMRRVLGEIKLISPGNLVKDWTIFPRMNENETWKRSDINNPFSLFFKTKIAETEKI